MAAASFATHLKHLDIQITLVDSSHIGTVGVGEATIPSIVNFNHQLGIDEKDFIQSTKATFKLGIEFENWNTKGSRFFHPFSDYGVANEDVDFHHYYYRLKKELNSDSQLEDYSIACQLAKSNKFAQPQVPSSSPLADFGYAYHFDAGLYAKYLEQIAIANGVEHLDSNVAEVNLDPQSGFIRSITLEDNSQLEGDFFIDCTGFRGLLIEKAMETGYIDWSQYLPCDSAVAVQSEAVGDPLPYTRSIADDSGWRWRIPLQHRMGNGYVFCSKYTSHDEAKSILEDSIEGDLLGDVKSFTFKAGRRKKVWNKNCYALGLASGFLEPIESTSISLIQTGIAHLLNFFPVYGYDKPLEDEVNRRHQHEMESIRDFIILHYKLTNRTDTAFWRYCQKLPIPRTLEHKIQLFQNTGKIVEYLPEAFEKSSWLTLFHGFDAHPKHHDNRADLLPIQGIESKLNAMKSAIANAASEAPLHNEFIKIHNLGTS